MKTCKDCVHYKICKDFDADYLEQYIKTAFFDGCDVTDVCEDFSDSSECIKPPIKIGQKVWFIENRDYSFLSKFPIEATVTEISQKTIKGHPVWGFIASGIRHKFDSIGKTVFLSYEDAAKSLEGKS